MEIILAKAKNLDMGQALNLIQDIAERVLSKKRWEEYLIASSNDANECEGMDGILLNGEYFDWKEFGWNKNSIIKAYLRYFTEEEIKEINVQMPFC